MTLTPAALDGGTFQDGPLDDEPDGWTDEAVKATVPRRKAAA